MNKPSVNDRFITNKSERRLCAARLALAVFLIATVTLGMTSTVQAQGGHVHHEIVDQAYKAFDRDAYPDLAALLDAHPNAVDGGAVFPDCCMNMPADGEWWDQMSEVAHSSAFQMAYLNVVRDAFRRHSTDEADLIRISFLFGVIAHNESDNPFHFGDGSSTPAFLTAALAADPDDNHAIVEYGADIFAVYEYGENLSTSWDFPVETVRAAFAALGHSVPALGLQQGLDMVAVVHATTPSDWLSFELTKIDLVWTHDNLQTYPVGGMQDSAYHAAQAWQLAWDELGTYRLFLPSIQDGPASSSLANRANLIASAGLQTSANLQEAGNTELYTAQMMRLARQLLDEGIVKVHSHTRDGIYSIESVEILNQQRLDQLTNVYLTEFLDKYTR
jgi:hypothetical protein